MVMMGDKFTGVRAYFFYAPTLIVSTAILMNSGCRFVNTVIYLKPAAVAIS